MLDHNSLEQRLFNIRERIGYLTMLRDTCPSHPKISQVSIEIRQLKRKHQALKQIGLHIPPTSLRTSADSHTA